MNNNLPRGVVTPWENAAQTPPATKYLQSNDSPPRIEINELLGTGCLDSSFTQNTFAVFCETRFVKNGFGREETKLEENFPSTRH
jgi:hypothetical protein